MKVHVTSSDNLGVVNEEYSTEEEIKARIEAGNREVYLIKCF